MLNTNHLTMQQKAELLKELLSHEYFLSPDEEEWCTYQINLRAAMLPRRDPSPWWHATGDHNDDLEELLTIRVDDLDMSSSEELI